MTRTASETANTLSIILWMTGALGAFVLAAVSIRSLGVQFNAFEIGAVRTGGGLVVLNIALWQWPSLRASVTTSRFTDHLLRNLAHALGGILWTIGITLLPLATVFSLEFTAPAWAALLAYPLIGERIRRQAVVGIVASLAGVILILRPSPATFDIVALIPVGAAFCFGISVLLTRKLTQTQTVFAVLYWMMMIQFPINVTGALFVPAQSGFAISPSAPTLIAMAMLVIAGLCSQLCLSRALQIGSAMKVIPLDFLRVPLIALIGWFFYGENLDAWVFAGAAVIMGGIWYGLKAGTQKEVSRNPSKADRNVPTSKFSLIDDSNGCFSILGRKLIATRWAEVSTARVHQIKLRISDFEGRSVDHIVYLELNRSSGLRALTDGSAEQIIGSVDQSESFTRVAAQ